MMTFEPKGGDGTSVHDVVFQLGEFYGLTQIAEDIAYRYNMPQHWYGMVQAFYPSNAIRNTTLIEFQMLPAPDFPTILLPLSELLNLIDGGEIDLRHFEQPQRFEKFNKHLKQVIRITEEHIELLLDNPELLDDWKIHCLYPYVAFEQRVKATYDWLTPQTDWFDIDANLIDWIFFVDQIIHEVDRPSSQDDDSDDGVPADVV